MHEHGESDSPIVPEKLANKGVPREGKFLPKAFPAEQVEERGLAKGNSRQQTKSRTQSRRDLQQALDRVRQAATRDRGLRFTALWHHVYNVDRLRSAYLALKRQAAAGVDGVTWSHYGEALEGNLCDLSDRLQRGAYRAKPVRRVYIPKADRRQRPIGVPTLEDKIVQRATTEVLNAVYETNRRLLRVSSRERFGNGMRVNERTPLQTSS